MTSDKEFRLSDYDETIRLVLDSGGEFRLYPKGTSMLPLIVQGRDSVSLVKSDSYKQGDIAFYLRSDGHYVLHRIIRADNGYFTMCGDNQLVLEEGIVFSQMIGKVKYVHRKDKKIAENDFLYGVYKTLWRSFFIRRVYFFLRRLKNGR